MISVISGKVGGGKTLLALTLILRDLAKGQGVATNIALNPDAVNKHLKKRFGFHHFSSRQITYLDLNDDIDFRDRTQKGTLSHPFNIYLDEAHIFFNSKDSEKLKKSFFPLLCYITQSRKLHQNIFFITQAPETLVNQFRLQAEEGYKCIDLRKKSFPIVGKIEQLGLAYQAYDWASGQRLRGGRTPINALLTDCFDTTQFYDTQTSELASGLEVFEPISRVNVAKAKYKFLKEKFLALDKKLFSKAHV